MKCFVLCCFVLLLQLVAAQQTQSYKTGVVTLIPKNMTSGYFVNVQRPAGELMITEVSFQVYDADTNMPIPIEDVYNHHVGLLEVYAVGNNSFNFSMLAAIGAEGDRTPITIPKGYGIYAMANSYFYITYDFINLWGIPAVANISVYVVYNISWVPYDSSIKSLLWILIDVTGFPNGTVYFDIPDSCPQTNNIYTKQLTFTWPYPDAQIVLFIGHVHIGSVSVSLTNSKSQTICKNVPTYDPYGFVDSMGTCVLPSNGQFTTNSQYTIAAEYECNGYQQVMGMLIGYLVADGSSIPASLRRFPFRVPITPHA